MAFLFLQGRICPPISNHRVSRRVIKYQSDLLPRRAVGPDPPFVHNKKYQGGFSCRPFTIS